MTAQRRPEPSRITLALDAKGLYGPGVDIACGVTEPAVDQWETGELTPTSEQLERLADLTGMTAEWFYLPPIEPITGHVFICGRGVAKCGWLDEQQRPCIRDPHEGDRHRFTPPKPRVRTPTPPTEPVDQDDGFISPRRAAEIRQKIEAEKIPADIPAASARAGACSRCGATPDQGPCYIPARLCGRPPERTTR